LVTFRIIVTHASLVEVWKSTLSLPIRRFQLFSKVASELLIYTVKHINLSTVIPLILIGCVFKIILALRSR